jgi:hypothetical protein
MTTGSHSGKKGMKTGPHCGKENNGNRTTLWESSTLDNTALLGQWEMNADMTKK